MVDESMVTTNCAMCGHLVLVPLAVFDRQTAASHTSIGQHCPPWSPGDWRDVLELM